jgi:hypothetical protein
MKIILGIGKDSRNKNISLPIILIFIHRVASAYSPADTFRRLIEGVILSACLFIFLLAFNPKFL